MILVRRNSKGLEPGKQEQNKGLATGELR